MVSEAFQDELRDPKRRKELFFEKEEISEDPKMKLFEDYLKVVDIHLVERGMGFKPAKSIEFGKTDQSMLNHIRNGIFFLFRFNDALEKLQARPLDEVGLRNCIALFVVHELHKLEFGEYLDEEAIPEGARSVETEFEIPTELIRKFVSEMQLSDFASNLTEDDYLSVAVALHKSRFSRSGARTSQFMDLEPFLYLMDNMASCTSPEEAVSIRSLTTLRDGFPQEIPENQLNLQYHRLDDVKGILTGIINKSTADIVEAQGLIMLMAYQDGCVYLAKGRNRLAISEELINKLYETLQMNIQKSTPALSESSSLAKKLSTPRLGYYGLSDEYYFFSGTETMLRSFIEKSITDAYAERTTGLTDSILDGMRRAGEVAHISLDNSKEGQRILLGFSRAVATIHKSFVSELISDNEQALRKSCALWGTPEAIKERLVRSMIEDPTLLANGGKWEYSYAIGQALMDKEIDGVKLRNTPPIHTINYMTKHVLNGLEGTAGWKEFVAKKTEIFRQELIEYLHDTLCINGTISQTGESKLSDNYHEYQGSGKICNLCNRGTLLNKKEMENSNSFLSFNFTNRVFAGKSKPTNIFTCIPCGVELALRLNGFDLPKGKAANGELLYFHIVPDYFFTPESWMMVQSIMLKFSGDARVRMAALSSKIFSSKYANEPEKEADIYDSWINDLAYKDEGEGAKGMGMAQYMAQGYGNLIGDTGIVFYKPSDNNTEFHFFGVYIALVIAAYTGMRIVISSAPVSSIRGRDFKEIIALDSVNSHVTDFYGRFVPLSRLETVLKAASALIQLGYNTGSRLKDSMFAKYLRVMRNESLPGSYLLKMVYRGSEKEYSESNVNNLLDEAIFLDDIKDR